MSKLIIKYASRSRPNLFVKALANIKKMTAGDYRVIVSADLDDRTMNNEQIRRFIRQYPRVSLHYGPHETKVAAINRDVPAEGWDWLVNFSDDFSFKVRGWDEIIKQQTKQRWGESFDWFAHYPDGFANEALPTMSIMGYDYYKRDGYIYHPCYKSFSCDAEAYYVAISRGCYHYFPEMLFKHDGHPANNRRLRPDALYLQNSFHTEHDTKTYFERLNNDFDLVTTGPNVWDEHKRLVEKNGKLVNVKDA